MFLNILLYVVISIAALGACYTVYIFFFKRKAKLPLLSTTANTASQLIKQIIHEQKLLAKERTDLVVNYILERKKLGNLRQIYEEIVGSDHNKPLHECIKKIDEALNLRLADIDMSASMNVGEATLEQNVSEKWLENAKVNKNELLAELKNNLTVAREEINSIKTALSQLRSDQYELDQIIQQHNRQINITLFQQSKVENKDAVSSKFFEKPFNI